VFSQNPSLLNVQVVFDDDDDADDDDDCNSGSDAI